MKKLALTIICLFCCSAAWAVQWEYRIVNLASTVYFRNDSRVKAVLKKKPLGYNTIQSFPGQTQEEIMKYATEEDVVHTIILDDFGKESWELVCIVHSGDKLLAYFKRPLK